jgi:hypothetical protein
MVDRYALHLVNAGTEMYLHIISSDRQHQAVLARQEKAVRGAELHASLMTTDPATLAALATEMLPDMNIETGA